MLGFAWLLRSEAARCLRIHIRGELDADAMRRFGWNVRLLANTAFAWGERDPSRVPELAAIELLTRYTARTEGKP